MSAPVDDLARRAFASAASKFVEVQRPSYMHMRGPNAPLTGLRFAAAAQSAGNPGLCKATTVWVDLGESFTPLQTETVFKVVGELGALPDLWNEQYGAELSRKCAASGRVLPTNSAAFGEVPFFSARASDENDVWLGARALEIAISRPDQHAAVTCGGLLGVDTGMLADLAADDPEFVESRENTEACAQPAAIVANLSLNRLLSLEVSPCPREASSFCVSAFFLRYAYSNHQALWEVKLKYEVVPGDNRDATNVRSVVLSPSYMIFD